MPDTDRNLANSPTEAEPDRPGKRRPLAPDVRPAPLVFTLEPRDDEDERAEADGLERERVEGGVCRGEEATGEERGKQLKKRDS